MLLVFCSFSFHGQVTDVDGEDVVCQIKNSAILARQLYTLHVSQIRIDLPTLTDKDKEVSYYLGVRYLVFTKWWTWGPNQFHPPVNSGNWCCSYHLTVAMENLFLNTKFSRFLSCNFSCFDCQHLWSDWVGSLSAAFYHWLWLHSFSLWH